MICFDLNSSIDWTAISSIATAVMAIATFITIFYNKKQIYEMRRQWNESNRPELEFSVITNGSLYILKIKNIGNKSAYNAHIKFNDDFVNTMLLEEAQEMIRDLSMGTKRILPNSSLYYPLSPLQNIDSFRTDKHSYSKNDIIENTKILLNIPITVTGSYNNDYTINETFTMNDYLGQLVVNEPIEASLSGINDSIKEIERRFSEWSFKRNNGI